MWARVSRINSTARFHSFLMAPSLLLGRHLVVFSTIVLKTRSISLVSFKYYNCIDTRFIDEIKWQIRLPKTLAMRSHAMPYNDEVQSQILNFLSQEIKHDYMEGSRDINLDLTVAEASKLYAAGSQLREMAESGEL